MKALLLSMDMSAQDDTHGPHRRLRTTVRQTTYVTVLIESRKSVSLSSVLSLGLYNSRGRALTTRDPQPAIVVRPNLEDKASVPTQDPTLQLCVQLRCPGGATDDYRDSES